MSEQTKSILQGAGIFSSAFLLALMLFIGAVQISLGFSPIRLWLIEVRLFHEVMTITKQSFDHIYSLHTVLLYGFSVLGVVVCLCWIFRRILLPFFRHFIFISQVQILWRPYAVFIVLTALFFLILSAAEVRMRYLSFCPGSRYMGNDFTPAHPSISYILLADDRGMNYFNKDSFHNHTDTTLFHVNEQGFPDWFDFTRVVLDSLSGQPPHRKHKMLFLGDSFAEGVGASRVDRSFIEIYRRRNPGTVVCNTGIGGMDPIQYRLVAEKYIPELAPDEVVVLFCGWNDLIMYDRPVVPHLPILTHMKDVGVVFNITPSDIAKTPAAAYAHYRQRFSLMEHTDFWARFCRQSCVGTRLYYTFSSVSDDLPVRPIDSFVVYRNLKRIQQLSDSAGARFTILFIPTPDMATMDSVAYAGAYQWAFRELWPHVRLCPRGMIRQSDCTTSMDYHFNDSGQRKFADYMQKVLCVQ